MPSISPARDAFKNAGLLTFANMQTPTIEQIETTIDVLAKLGERFSIQAAHFIVQLPETQMGTYYAGNMGSEILEQILHIENLTKKLKIWEDELMGQANEMHSGQARHES